MSMMVLGFPAEIAPAIVETLAPALLRWLPQLLGTAMLIALLLLFRPLLTGVFQAALLLVHPRRTREQRRAASTFGTVMLLTRMTRDCGLSDPGQAAELRAMAARA